MNIKTVLTLILVGYCIFCAVLVLDSGLFEYGRRADEPCVVLQQSTTAERTGEVQEAAGQEMQLRAADFTSLRADNAPAETIILGAADPYTEEPETGFKFQLELSSKGAAIARATFSNGEGKGFDDRDYKDPQPLVILSPVHLADGGEVLSMANGQFVFVQQKLQLPLDRLHWKSLGVERHSDGSQTARFEATINTSAGRPVVKLTKTYKVTLGSFDLDCDLTVENLSPVEQQVRYGLAGPTGIGREGVRGDMRKVIGCFRTADNQIVSSRSVIRGSFFSRNVGLKKAVLEYQRARQTADKAQIEAAKSDLRIGRNLSSKYKGAHFLWAATTNKYFAAILRPVPGEAAQYCEWVADKTGWYYNPDGDVAGDSGDETIGINLETVSTTLAAAGQAASTRKYGFQLYLGPKDRDLFYDNPLYKGLGFEQAIDFMPCCCCPTNIIRPLAFGILAAMKWMHGFIPNYGVVIMILVFLIRLALHPLTKKSQVSMSKFSKFNALPEVQEIRKKYAKSMMEMNKRISQLQKQHGISPHHMVVGMLPMFVQMPIWISLYSAIYASIDLRGAAFLPVWITDLSAPDALFRFSTITLPLFGKLNSFNLLPILMGVAFFLQQKMMPSQADASSSPQMAQQQKMMKIMFPLLFPLMLYKAPSGLNLYIMSSVFAGVFEQHFIKKHIHESQQTESRGLVSATSKTGGKVKKKKPKPFYRQF